MTEPTHSRRAEPAQPEIPPMQMTPPRPQSARRANMFARLPWPLPALLVWASAWALFVALVRYTPMGAVAAMALASVAGALCSSWGAGSHWRRALIALGFPLSLALSGLAAVPAWAWLVPLAVFLALYPVHAWRDAPVFPTPRDALHAVPAAAPLPPGACVLDAGCGLGHGLRALRRAYPEAAVQGVEWSWPLWAWCALRCPWATVRRGDLWRADWSACALVYVFQRPESMARVADKAQGSMVPGSWLVSLEFEIPHWPAQTCVAAPDGRPVWLYRIGSAAALPESQRQPV